MTDCSNLNPRYFLSHFHLLGFEANGLCLLQDRRTDAKADNLFKKEDRKINTLGQTVWQVLKANDGA